MTEFQCEICEKVFNTKVKLRGHYNYNHKNCDKVFNCNVCTKSFQLQSNLATHIKNVHGEKHYNCDCGKSFSNPWYLKKHIHRVHEGHKDFKCESCGKPFSQAGHLRRHIRAIHEN